MTDWSKFPFGKYSYEHFTQCQDLRYLTWFIGNLNNEMQIKYCAEAIIKLVDKLQNGEVIRNKKKREKAKEVNNAR